MGALVPVDERDHTSAGLSIVMDAQWQRCKGDLRPILAAENAAAASFIAAMKGLTGMFTQVYSHGSLGDFC
jgi:hypothetical protein